MKTKSARSARRYKIINSPSLRWEETDGVYFDDYKPAICDRYIARFMDCQISLLPNKIVFQISRQKFNGSIKYPFKFNSFGVRHGSNRGGLYRWASDLLLLHYPNLKNKDVYLYVKVKPIGQLNLNLNNK